MLQHGPKLAQLGSNLGPKTSPKGAPRPLPRATFDGKPKTLILTTVLHFFYIFGVPGGLWETRFRLKIDVPKQHLFQECLETFFLPHKHRKIKKVPKIGSQRGGPGWPSNVVFGDFGVLGPPWGPPWLPDLAPGLSRPLRTLIFGDFS